MERGFIRQKSKQLGLISTLVSLIIFSIFWRFRYRLVYVKENRINGYIIKDYQIVNDQVSINFGILLLPTLLFLLWVLISYYKDEPRKITPYFSRLALILLAMYYFRIFVLEVDVVIIFAILTFDYPTVLYIPLSNIYLQLTLISFLILIPVIFGESFLLLKKKYVHRLSLVDLIIDFMLVYTGILIIRFYPLEPHKFIPVFELLGFGFLIFASFYLVVLGCLNHKSTRAKTKLILTFVLGAVTIFLMPVYLTVSINRGIENLTYPLNILLLLTGGIILGGIVSRWPQFNLNRIYFGLRLFLLLFLIVSLSLHLIAFNETHYINSPAKSGNYFVNQKLNQNVLSGEILYDFPWNVTGLSVVLFNTLIPIQIENNIILPLACLTNISLTVDNVDVHLTGRWFKFPYNPSSPPQIQITSTEILNSSHQYALGIKYPGSTCKIYYTSYIF